MFVLNRQQQLFKNVFINLEAFTELLKVFGI